MNKKAATRDGFGDKIAEIGKKNDKVVVLSADLTESTRCEKFKELFPNRFIEVGVAEQNMVGIAAGLALDGRIPFIASFASFSPGGNFGQIRISICYSNANVKIIGSHAGLSTGPDGASHQALEDIAIARALPNLTTLVPADYEETKKVVQAACDHKGPVYIRLTREPTPVFTTSKTPFRIGRAQVLVEGKDITIISAGPIIYEALKAANELKEKYEISCEVINCASIKPLDESTILESVKKTGLVLTLEEHQIAGGLGGAVAELLSTKLPTKMRFLGINDSFGESGTQEELWEKHEISKQHVKIEVREMLRKII